jgi:hypothetical protein
MKRSVFVGQRIVDKVGYVKDIATDLKTVRESISEDGPTCICRRLMRVT